MADPLGAMIEQRAQQLVREREFNDACNRTVDAGEAEFPDFAAALQTYRALGGGAPSLIEAALATAAPHKAIYHLGKHPEEAMRILALPALKQVVELARIEAKIGKSADRQSKPASAPTEIEKPATDATSDAREWGRQRRAAIAERLGRPTTPAAASTVPAIADDMPMADFYRARVAQRRERHGR